MDQAERNRKVKTEHELLLNRYYGWYEICELTAEWYEFSNKTVTPMLVHVCAPRFWLRLKDEDFLESKLIGVLNNETGRCLECRRPVPEKVMNFYKLKNLGNHQ